MKGILHLSHVTGTEHNQISQILLGLVINIQLPNNMSPARLLRAVQGILDILFLARYPVYTNETLDLSDAEIEGKKQGWRPWVSLVITFNPT